MELEVGNDDVVSATDDKTITILDPLNISSATNQLFNQEGGATAIATITITEDGAPSITDTNDIRIRIPSGFNMTWDISDTTATIGGAAAADSVMVASEPLTSDVTKWLEVPEYAMLHTERQQGRPITEIHYLDV